MAPRCRLRSGRSEKVKQKHKYHVLLMLVTSQLCDEVMSPINTTAASGSKLGIQLARFPMFNWHQSKLFPNEQNHSASSYFGGIHWPEAAPQIWISNMWLENGLSSDLQSPCSGLFAVRPAHLARRRSAFLFLSGGRPALVPGQQAVWLQSS